MIGMSANVPAGSIVAQGPAATVDARTYVQQTTTVNVSVEDRARILAEVGAALRPVLEGMAQRIAGLEAELDRLRFPALQPPTAGPHTSIRAGHQESPAGALPFHTTASDESLNRSSAAGEAHDPPPSSRSSARRGTPGGRASLPLEYVLGGDDL